MPVPRSKLSPPPAPTELIEREEAWFEEAMRRRLTVVVADAGYGKSTLLGIWAQRAPSGWYTAGPTDTSAVRLADGLAEALGVELRADEASADALAAQLVEAVEGSLEQDTLLVLDDAHELASDGAPMQLVQALVQQLPPRLHLAIGSRSALPFSIERLRGQGQVGEVDAADLRFTSTEIRTLVAASLGEEVDALAAAITELTEGWPAATRLAVESLRRLPPNARHEALSRAGRPGGSLFAYLTDEVLRNEPPEVRALLEHVAPLEAFTLELCAELGFPNAPGDLDRLGRGGLFLDAHGGSGGWLRLHALVREAVLADSDEDTVRDVRVRAARWLEANGLQEDALRAWTALGDAVAVKRLLSTDALLLSGAYAAIVDAARVVSQDLADAPMQEVVGDAYHCLGDDAAARAWLERAGARGATPGLRFRLGLLYPDRPREALAAWDPDSLVAGERYTAAILTYAALAATTAGDPERGRVYAERALEDDDGKDDPFAGEALNALGHALFEMGRTAEAETLHRKALRINDQENTPIASAHALLRLAVCALHQGRYDEALSLVDLAANRSRLLIHVLWEQMLRAECSFRLGQLDEALAELESGRAAYARLGYLLEAWPLALIGHIHRERGALALARSAYERAIELAEEAGAPYILAPALAGLARVTAFDEPDAAAELAARAVAHGSVHSRHADVLLGSGWVALATGRVEDADRFAKEAEVEARRRGQVAELAEAVELAGVATRSAPRLREALDLWRRLDAQLGAARTELALAELTGSSADGALAVGRLGTLGVQPDAAGLAAGTYAAFPHSEAAVSVTTLGGFRVLREGRPVPTSEWQSRKARELLKILLCQRGRPLTRDAVMELLWPDQDPAPLAKRLSVLLATVRGVLDPHKSLPPDHYVPAKGGSIAVDLDHVELDVDRFLRLADAGAYADAEPLYTGELLPEDAYEDWSTPLRDEARLAYVAVARRLAAEADDADTALRLWQRILVQDPHDEGAHLALVRCLRAAGRHGEARRRYVAYVARMAELGVEPEVFPER